MVAFAASMIFNVMKPNSWSILGIISFTIIVRSRKFVPMFSSSNIKVSGLTLRSLIPVELQFCQVREMDLAFYI